MTKQVSAIELTEYCNKILNSNSYKDGCVNGLQVDATFTKPIKKIAYSVDAGLSVIKAAIKINADILLTHHALIWGQGERAITDISAQKLGLLFNNKCSLFSYHLPLDGDLTYGNGIGIANWFKTKKIDISKISGFGMCDGSFVGLRGELKKAVSLNEIYKILKTFPDSSYQYFFPFGKQTIKTIGIVTGAGDFAIQEAAINGIDLFLSGEPKQSVYHNAKEAEQSCAFVGHYASETFGVELLAKHIGKKFGIDIVKINEPTGI